MDTREFEMHLRVGRVYGAESTCGTKQDRRDEVRATADAERLSTATKKLEAYPCAFCGSWHIGRALTESERAEYMPPEDWAPPTDHPASRAAQ